MLGLGLRINGGGITDSVVPFGSRFTASGTPSVTTISTVDYTDSQGVAKTDVAKFTFSAMPTTLSLTLSNADTLSNGDTSRFVFAFGTSNTGLVPRTVSDPYLSSEYFKVSGGDTIVVMDDTLYDVNRWYTIDKTFTGSKASTFETIVLVKPTTGNPITTIANGDILYVAEMRVL